jgi:hypothetical protein
MQTIPLSQGRIALIDDEDVAIVSQYRWHAIRQETLRAAPRWYAGANIRNRTVLLHQIVSGAPGVDHIDGDGLNNQKHNLRAASKSQNAANAQKRSGTTSRYKGVSKDKRRGDWKAEISCGGTRHWLGYYMREEEAAMAYDRKAVELFGAYARLNFGPEFLGELESVHGIRRWLVLIQPSTVKTARW